MALMARLMLDVNVLAMCSGTVLCAAVWRAGLYLPCGRKVSMGVGLCGLAHAVLPGGVMATIPGDVIARPLWDPKGGLFRG